MEVDNTGNKNVLPKGRSGLTSTIFLGKIVWIIERGGRW